jgi:hypothetical protein
MIVRSNFGEHNLYCYVPVSQKLLNRSPCICEYTSKIVRGVFYSAIAGSGSARRSSIFISVSASVSIWPMMPL